MDIWRRCCIVETILWGLQAEAAPVGGCVGSVSFGGCGEVVEVVSSWGRAAAGSRPKGQGIQGSQE